MDQEIIKVISSAEKSIEQSRVDEAYRLLQKYVEEYLERVDERFQIEMGLLLRLAEYKRERQGYINQLAIDLTYQYCEKKLFMY